MSESIPTTGPISPEIRAAGQLLVDMYAALWEQVKAPFQPMIDMFEADPERFERMCWDLEREREAEQAQQSCHCLCGMHRDQGMNCTGIATAHRTIVSPTMGTVHVPMCEPCHSAVTVKA